MTYFDDDETYMVQVGVLGSNGSDCSMNMTNSTTRVYTKVNGE